MAVKILVGGTIMEGLINLLESFSTYVELLVLVISWAIGFTHSKIMSYFKKYKLLKLLGLKRADSDIILPIRKGALVVKEQPEMVLTTPTYNLVPYEEAANLLVTQQLVNFVDSKAILNIKTPEEVSYETIKNKFVFGGPYSNAYVRAIFSPTKTGTYSFKEPFKFGCSTESFNLAGNEELKPFRKIADECNGKVLFYGNNETPFYYEEDYIVLIKLSSKTLNDNNHGTVHICFGKTAMSTQLALKCITEHTDVIYSKVKKHPDSYFLLLKCSSNGEVRFDNNSLIDITEIMIGN